MARIWYPSRRRPHVILRLICLVIAESACRLLASKNIDGEVKLDADAASALFLDDIGDSRIQLSRCESYASFESIFDSRLSVLPPMTCNNPSSTAEARCWRSWHQCLFRPAIRLWIICFVYCQRSCGRSKAGIYPTNCVDDAIDTVSAPLGVGIGASSFHWPVSGLYSSIFFEGSLSSR